jgi:hypothetical protein
MALKFSKKNAPRAKIKVNAIEVSVRFCLSSIIKGMRVSFGTTELALIPTSGRR